MRDVERNLSDMITRGSDFGAGHAADFPATSLGGQKFAAIVLIVDEFNTHGANQAGGRSAAQASTQAIQAARVDLRSKMIALRATAIAMEEERPGISANFRVPSTKGDQALISAARAAIATATPLKSEFLKREMPATFLEDLTALITELENQVNERNANREKHVTATAAIKDALKRGVKLMRELDPIVRNKYRDDPATLAAWDSATHVPRPAKKKKAVLTEPSK
jgi:hypothetical protein